jgi:hypothetical protein
MERQGLSGQQIAGQIHRWHPNWTQAEIEHAVMTSDAPVDHKLGVTAHSHRGALAVGAASSAHALVKPTSKSITPLRRGEPTASSRTPNARAASITAQRGKKPLDRSKAASGPERGSGLGDRGQLSRVLPNINVAVSRTKTVKIESPEVTITSHISAEALVTEHGRSRLSVGFDPRRREGSLAVKEGDFALTVDSVLSKSRLRSRDMISQLVSHASITGSSTQAMDLGSVPVTIGGRKLSIPASAAVSISVSPPNKVKADIAVDLSVWDARGNLTTIEVSISVDAEVTIHPQGKFPLRDPFPAMAHQLVHVVEASLQELSKILQHAPKFPGGPLPLPVPAAR